MVHVVFPEDPRERLCDDLCNLSIGVGRPELCDVDHVGWRVWLVECRWRVRWSPKVGGSGGDVAVGAGIGDGCSAPPSLGSLLLVSPVAASWPALSFFMTLEAPCRIVLAPLQA